MGPSAHVVICRVSEVLFFCSSTVPEGYADYWDAASGLCRYVDHLHKTEWLTALDDENRVYFYQEESQASVWALPPIEGVHYATRCQARQVDAEGAWLAKFVVLCNACYLKVYDDDPAANFRQEDISDCEELNISACSVRKTSTTELEIIGPNCALLLRWSETKATDVWRARLTHAATHNEPLSSVYR